MENVVKKRLFETVDPDEDVIKQGENILYLLLIEGDYTDDSAEVYRFYEFITGRQEAYDKIKDLLEYEDENYRINVDTSIIYAENPNIKNSRLKLSNGITFYKFMTDCVVLGKVKDESSFCIDDYHQEPDPTKEVE